jgi:hypothetical protein
MALHGRPTHAPEEQVWSGAQQVVPHATRGASQSCCATQAVPWRTCPVGHSCFAARGRHAAPDEAASATASDVTSVRRMVSPAPRGRGERSHLAPGRDEGGARAAPNPASGEGRGPAERVFTGREMPFSVAPRSGVPAGAR